MKSIYENPECVFYKYEIVWSEEDEAYIGSVKEFPGLMAHHERSFTKALSEIVHVVDIALSIMKEDGHKIPQPEGFNKFDKNILLNGKEMKLSHKDMYNLTYERIVELAEMFGNPTITYRGKTNEQEEILYVGRSIKPSNGMVINCCHTSNA